MKKLALIALMIAGSASIASASPFRFSARGSVRFSTNTRVNEPTIVVRDHRYQDRYQDQDRYVEQQEPEVVIVRDIRANRSWSVTPCHDIYFNVSGFYTGPAGDVMLTQHGNQIFGTFANGGEMRGTIENGKITYVWTGGQYHGRGFWYVDGRGKLIGMWGANNSDGSDGSSGGNWNLTLAHR